MNHRFLLNPVSEHERLARQERTPRLLQIIRGLERLQTTTTVMTIGAHPDDEPSALLAALRHHVGLSVVMVCITRGEGGQNTLGSERGQALGALRTREMEAAAQSLDARLEWIGAGMDDTVHDFGFSKDGQDTLNRWQEKALLERLVRAIRRYRPDVVMNCFRDVAGQHGHHRAVVMAVDKALCLAADAHAYPAHFADGLTPWQVAKVYDPAWSGGGDTYDDEQAPPSPSLIVRVPERDAVSGASWGQIGEWSRVCHLSQSMGRWFDAPQSAFALHRRDQATPEQSILDNLTAATFARCARLDGMSDECAASLLLVEQAIHAAKLCWHNDKALFAHVLTAAKALRDATANLPKALWDEVAHRLARKQREIDALLALAAGVNIRAWAVLSADDALEIRTHQSVPDGMTVKLKVRAREGLQVEGMQVRVADAELSNPLPKRFDPLGGNGEIWLEMTLHVEDYEATLALDLEDRIAVVPQSALRVNTAGLVWNLEAPQTLRLQFDDVDASALHLPVPEGWQVERVVEAAQRVRYAVQPSAELGRFVLQPEINGLAAWQVDEVAYPHIGRVVLPRLVRLPVQVMQVALPEARVGYVGAGHDGVAAWLRQLGIAVVELDELMMREGAFEAFDTLIVGVFAFGKRADLQSALSRIHAWVHAGGHLLSLYHRPSDGWDAQRTPPAHLKIGSPSIRYRVTDENATVTHVSPQHKLLNYPNKITAEDWQGWDKERGLYFASAWDKAYEPLVAMSDAGEVPLLGGLLSATIGRGRYTHTALNLHHQLDKLTVGAFRLMANLVQKA